MRATTVACCRREEGESAAFLSRFGAALDGRLSAGVGSRSADAGRLVPLPLYPWQRERHWASTADRVSASSVPVIALRDDEALSWVYRQTWKMNDPPRLRVVAVGRAFSSRRTGRTGPIRLSYRP